jgi:hypothetical protein
MDKLPPEILRGILGALIALNPSSKNEILPFRLVCKVFNELLREDLLKTVQLDFSRLEKHGKPLDLKYLEGAAEYCDAIYVDLTIIRDDGMSFYSSTTLSGAMDHSSRIARALCCINPQDNLLKQLLTLGLQMKSFACRMLSPQSLTNSLR